MNEKSLRLHGVDAHMEDMQNRQWINVVTYYWIIRHSVSLHYNSYCYLVVYFTATYTAHASASLSLLGCCFT